MTIHKLVLYNFKSYRNKHVIGPFDRFSCIVGPNGSGKSNIMDAISFAFSLSTKYLRASNLEELINEGCDYASVEVIFDDKLHENNNIQTNNSFDYAQRNENQPMQNSTYTSIKRLIKNGTSTFFIDDTKTTQEQYHKFLESKNIYAKVKNFLIFQGEIEVIAHKQPIELTKMIEEISGSIAYKQEYEDKEQRMKVLYSECAVLLERKKETNNRLKNMKENKELYKKYNKNIKKREELYMKMKKRQVYEISKKLNEKKKEIQKLENDMQQIKEKINEIEKIINREEMYEIQKRIYEKENEITKIGEEMKKYEEKKIQEELSKINSKVCDNVKTNEDELRILEEELKEYENGLIAIKQKYFSNNALFHVDNAIIEEYERLNRIYKERIQNNKEMFFDENAYNSENDYIDNDRKNNEIINSTLCDEIEMLKSKIDQNNKIIEMMYNKRKDGFDSYNEINEKEKKLNIEFNSVMKDLLLHKSLQKENESKIKIKDSVELLKSKFTGVYGCLIDLVKPLQKKYEIALSVLLKGYENAIIVDSQETSIECIKYMKIKKIGMFMFIPLNDIKNITNIKNDPSAVLAIDAIEYDKKYEKAIKFVFRDSLILENNDKKHNPSKNYCNKKEDTGLKTQSNRTCVSLSGVLYHKNGSITAGKINSKFVDLNQMIKKKNEILNKLKDLSLQKNCYAHIEIVNEKIIKMKKENEEYKEKIRINEEKISAQKNKNLKNIVQNKNNEMIMKNKVALENEIFQNFIYKNRLQEFRDFIENREFYVKKKEEEYEKIKHVIETKKKEIQEKNIVCNNEKTNIDSFYDSTINSNTNSNVSVDYAGLLNTKLNEINELKKEIENKRRKNKIYEEEINKEYEEIKKVNMQIFEKQKEEYKMNEEIKEIEKDIQENNDYNTCDSILDVNDIIDCSYEHYENEYNKICLELQNIPVKVLNENNLINEYEKINFEYEEKRKSVLKEKEDFESTKKIRVSLFMECFNKINSSICDIYKLLTSIDGSAYIILENNSEPYKDGLKFFVMPPKKRYMEMKMLSGGEKTMAAALALLFSFHSYKPSSFYIFDELDSALDKINVRKIINFILKSNLQFIAITLKPEFFENGESLVGVYKKNKVSQILTLKM